jgi:hypothetical protein
MYDVRRYLWLFNQLKYWEGAPSPSVVPIRRSVAVNRRPHTHVGIYFSDVLHQSAGYGDAIA